MNHLYEEHQLTVVYHVSGDVEIITAYTTPDPDHTKPYILFDSFGEILENNHPDFEIIRVNGTDITELIDVINKVSGDQGIDIVTIDGVSCYGAIGSDSVIVMAFDDENFDGISESSFDTWREAVKECSDYAKSVGTTLVQLEAE